MAHTGVCPALHIWLPYLNDNAILLVRKVSLSAFTYHGMRSHVSCLVAILLVTFRLPNGLNSKYRAGRGQQLLGCDMVR
jgi:hypothetical protein